MPSKFAAEFEHAGRHCVVIEVVLPATPYIPESTYHNGYIEWFEEVTYDDSPTGLSQMISYWGKLPGSSKPDAWYLGFHSDQGFAYCDPKSLQRTIERTKELAESARGL
jgi:hypothetical protein